MRSFILLTVKIVIDLMGEPLSYSAGSFNNLNYILFVGSAVFLSLSHKNYLSKVC